MKQIKTLEDALSLVPKYWPLTPRVDRWKEGDERYSLMSERFEDLSPNPNAELLDFQYGDLIVRRDLGRRPIPEFIRLNAARWVLYDAMADVDPSQRRFIFCLRSSHQSGNAPFITTESYGGGLRGFSSEAAASKFIQALGPCGKSDAYEMLKCGPNVLLNWARENRT